ncbi:MAG: hypothetical protein WEB04_02250 [Dehalococcoidia bacterium]
MRPHLLQGRAWTLPRQAAAARALGLLLIIAGFVAFAVYVAWGESLDDAAISFAYSKNLVHGHGLVLSPGADPVEAYSNFLWVMAMVPVVAAGIDALIAAKVVGLALSVAVIVLLAGIPSRARGDEQGWFDLLAPTLTALSLPFALWSVSGMENALESFLLVLAVALTVREVRHPGALPWSSLALFGVAITRPEGVIFFVAACGHRALLVLLGRREWKQDARWLAAYIAPLLLYHVWHYAYFGELVPNTYFAKAEHREIGDLFSYMRDPDDPGFAYVRSFVGDYWLLPVLFLLPLCLIGRRGLSTYSLPLLMVLAGATSALFVGGDWMEYHRFMSPLVPLIFLCAQEGLRAGVRPIESVLGSVGIPSIASSSAAAALAAALVATMAIGNTQEVDRAHDRPFGAPYAGIKQHADAMEQLAARLHLEDATVLTPDIGAVAYTTDLEIVDLAGLGDAYIARHHSIPEIAHYVFVERRPDIISLHGVWVNSSQLDNDPRLWTDYVPQLIRTDAAGGLIRGTFVRRDLVLFDGSCPDAIPWDQAASLPQGVATVSGAVVGDLRPVGPADPAVFYLGAAQGLPIVISAADRLNFPVPPHYAYLGQDVCATGNVGMFQGKAAVYIQAPSNVLISSASQEVEEQALGLAGGWVAAPPGAEEPLQPVADVVDQTLPRAELISRLAALKYTEVLLEPGSPADLTFRSVTRLEARDFHPSDGAPPLALRTLTEGLRWGWGFGSGQVARVGAVQFTVPQDIAASPGTLDFEIAIEPSVAVDADQSVTMVLSYVTIDDSQAEIINAVSAIPLPAGTAPGTRVALLRTPSTLFAPGDTYQLSVWRLTRDEADNYPGNVWFLGLRILYLPAEVELVPGAGLLRYPLR